MMRRPLPDYPVRAIETWRRTEEGGVKWKTAAPVPLIGAALAQAIWDEYDAISSARTAGARGFRRLPRRRRPNLSKAPLRLGRYARQIPAKRIPRRPRRPPARRRRGRRASERKLRLLPLRRDLRRRLHDTPPPARLPDSGGGDGPMAARRTRAVERESGGWGVGGGWGG